MAPCKHARIWALHLLPTPLCNRGCSLVGAVIYLLDGGLKGLVLNDCCQQSIILVKLQHDLFN